MRGSWCIHSPEDGIMSRNSFFFVANMCIHFFMPPGAGSGVPINIDDNQEPFGKNVALFHSKSICSVRTSEQKHTSLFQLDQKGNSTLLCPVASHACAHMYTSTCTACNSMTEKAPCELFVKKNTELRLNLCCRWTALTVSHPEVLRRKKLVHWSNYNFVFTLIPSMPRSIKAWSSNAPICWRKSRIHLGEPINTYHKFSSVMLPTGNLFSKI